jgi:hypothetical protein
MLVLSELTGTFRLLINNFGFLTVVAASVAVSAFSEIEKDAYVRVPIKMLDIS